MKKSEIRQRLISITFTIFFLVVSTFFIFEPRREQMSGALSFVEKMNALSFTAVSDDLALTYDFPIPDSMVGEVPPYEFEVGNTGSLPIAYQLTFFTGDSVKKIPQNAIRYRIQKNDEEYSEVQTLSEDGEITVDVVNGGSINHYSLKFWVHSDVDSSILGKTFQGIINLTAVQ